MKKLPVIRIVIGALYFPWALRRSLFKALAILIMAGVALSTAWWYAKESMPEHFGWGVTILFWALYTLFAVICHRIVLLGGASVPEYGVTRISEREVRFALALGKIAIITIPVTIVGAMVIQIPMILVSLFTTESTKIGITFEYLPWAVYLIQIYILARLGFILPATAIDQRPSLRWAWQVSRGNTLRLMLVLGFLPWLLYLPFALFPEDLGLTGYSLYVFIWWLFLPFEITVLSLSYKEMMQEQLAT